MTVKDIDNLLMSQAEEDFRAFSAKIINTRLPMLGVRTPYIKKLASRIARECPQEFLDTYKPENYEQVLLYSLVTASAKLPIEKKFDYLDVMLPLYDNWAHIDITVSAFRDLGKNKAKFTERYSYLCGGSEFERRFFIIYLLDYCLTAEEIESTLALAAQMQCDRYYVNMGIAWLYSVALVKFYDQTVRFMSGAELSDFVLRKTVQKARDSYRISPERKAELTALFIKK